MQIIRTKSFKQTRLDFALQVILSYFRTRWIFVVLLFLIAIMQVSMKSKYASIFMGLAFLFPVMICFFLYFMSGNNHLKWYYQEKSLRIDPGGFKMDFPNGKKERVKWDQVKKMKKTKSAYQLYNDPPLFMTLPFNVFETEEDRHAFEQIVRENNLLK